MTYAIGELPIPLSRWGLGDVGWKDRGKLVPDETKPRHDCFSRMRSSDFKI